MKLLDLESYDVQSMSEYELKKVNGGWIHWVVEGAIFLATRLTYDILSNWPDSVENFNKGKDNAMNRWK